MKAAVFRNHDRKTSRLERRGSRKPINELALEELYRA